MEEKKDRPFLKIVVLLVALGLAMAWGMVVGGGLVYIWTHHFEDRGEPVGSRVITLQTQPEKVERWIWVPGALVTKVVTGSPADMAGLEVGDRIVAVDGQRVGLRDLAKLIAQYEPRDRVTLVIQRAGDDPFEVRVRLGEHPEKRGTAYLGVYYSSSSSLQSPGIKILPYDESGEHDSLLPEGRSEGFFFAAPFDLDDLPHNLEELLPGFDFHWLPGGDDDA